MTYDSTRGNASLRHEINNSLTLISSRLQLLAARYDFLKKIQTSLKSRMIFQISNVC